MARHNRLSNNKGMIPLSRLYIVAVLAFVGGLLIGTTIGSFSSSGQSVSVQAEKPVQSTAGSKNNHVLELEQQSLKDPTNASLWAHLGNAYYDARRPKEAIKAYERSLSLVPNNPDIITDLATMYRADGQFQVALDKYNTAISINARHQNARFNKGIVLYYDLNRKDEAKAAWQALLAVSPNAKAPDGTLVSDLIKQLFGN